MIVIFGLAVLLAAVIVGTAGVLSNSGDKHALTDSFAVFGNTSPVPPERCSSTASSSAR